MESKSTEKRFTLAEVCNQLGISRQALHKKLVKYNIYPTKEGNRSYLTAKQIDDLKRKPSSKYQRRVDTKVDGMVDILNKQIDFLKTQLEQSREREAELLKQAGQAQALLLAFQQQNQRLEQENRRLLLEAPPSATVDAKPVATQEEPGMLGRIWKKAKRKDKQKKKR